MERTEFGCTDLDARFAEMHIPEAMVELAVPGTEIDSLDILIMEILQDVKKKKNSWREGAPVGIESRMIWLQTTFIESPLPESNRVFVDVQDVNS